jgi:hypothetical protein
MIEYQPKLNAYFDQCAGKVFFELFTNFQIKYMMQPKTMEYTGKT